MVHNRRTFVCSGLGALASLTCGCGRESHAAVKLPANGPCILGANGDCGDGKVIKYDSTPPSWLDLTLLSSLQYALHSFFGARPLLTYAVGGDPFVAKAMGQTIIVGESFRMMSSSSSTRPYVTELFCGVLAHEYVHAEQHLKGRLPNSQETLVRSVKEIELEADELAGAAYRHLMEEGIVSSTIGALNDFVNNWSILADLDELGSHGTRQDRSNAILKGFMFKYQNSDDYFSHRELELPK